MSFLLTPISLVLLGSLVGVINSNKIRFRRLTYFFVLIGIMLVYSLTYLLYYDLITWPLNFNGSEVAGSVWFFHTDITGVYKTNSVPSHSNITPWVVVPWFISLGWVLSYPFWLVIPYKLVKSKFYQKPSLSQYPHVVIVGAGFAGLAALHQFIDKKIRVTVIDKNNYYTFTPLLYQIASAELSPEQIVFPIRSVLKEYDNMDFVLGSITDVETNKNVVVLENNNEISYDYLILGMGTETNYFGVSGAETNSFALKNMNDAIMARNEILQCFEKASVEKNQDRKKELLTFVIVGGGPTGVEFTGALSELIFGPMMKDFPGLDPGEVNIILVEALSNLLTGFPQKLGLYAKKRLIRMGVEVWLGQMVKELADGQVTLSDGTIIKCGVIVWSGGARGPENVKSMPFQLNKNGQIRVQPTLQSLNTDNVFVVGDLAVLEQRESPLPLMAPVAKQQGKKAARNVLKLLEGKEPSTFHFLNKGSLATIGRNKAVAHFGPLKITGVIAWFLWVVVHIYFLVGYRNRLMVMGEWAWSYLFFERAFRLIMPTQVKPPN